MKTRTLLAFLAPVLGAAAGLALYPRSAGAADDTPIAVKLVKSGGGFQLQRDGKPYFIKGAGGNDSRQLLKASGGNSIRTWGVDGLGPILTEAQSLGITVTAGIWLGHKDQGFDYHNAAQVAAQYKAAEEAIMKYRNSPSLLMWAIGNEMENGSEDDPEMWKAVEDIAALAKKLDPNHPTMTVFAEVGGNKVAQLNKYCPDIDILGINSYAGGPSVADRYKTAGGVKPFVITEFGPPGTWELKANDWGAAPEPTSTEKSKFYRDTYEKSVLHQPLSLGSYTFLWSHKQEATATWFGMLLPDGSKLAPVDAMTQLWSGKPPVALCPTIEKLTLDGEDKIPAGSEVKATLAASSPQKYPLTVKWVLRGDPMAHVAGGAPEGVPDDYPDAIQTSDTKHAVVKIPATGGPYRLFAYISDGHKASAVANIPLYATGGAAASTEGTKAKLPFVIYSEADGDTPYTPAGYMGNTGAIQMDPGFAENPHAGKTSLKVQYTANDNWGGVVWQSPANDWGEKPGGWNVTGAKQLSFWARGDQGGEVVAFSFGLIGTDKKYPDRASGKTGNVTLTKEWKQYSIDVSDLDLTRVKTGFVWVVAGQGHPVTFYLDDIEYR
ncbi:MAG: glycoside hydrolase family 2 TIM barrel-domain containing protein [Capsulimonas sp.]|uniref:glycoside hydrolase family 2 TIM barrel-domain containing protein n=1 Tax=Capsulimonas sp. TaxID=2494211 RepID=UPI003263CD64